VTNDSNTPQSMTTRRDLLTRSFNIRIPPWGGLAILISLVAFVVFMTARQRAELRDEWASPDRPAIVALESMKKQLLVLDEVEALSADFVLLVEDGARLTRALRGDNSPFEAAALNNLANIYVARGEYDKAIPMFEQSKRLVTKYLGAEHEDVVTIDDNIRTAHADKQKAANAEQSPGDDSLKAASQE